MGENILDPVWKSPTPPPILECDRIHIWRANLDLPEAKISHLNTLLSPDEVAKANKFRFPIHRRRYIAARGILRQLLGNYLQISPSKLKFDYGDRGKPRLSNLEHSTPLQFNVSHSQEYALYGLTYHDPIGVDLEYIRKMPDAVKIAQRFFSSREYELIKSTVGKEQQILFFTLWTAKEAYLKAIGTGLAGDLSSIGLEVSPSGLITGTGKEDRAMADWSFYPCLPAMDYTGAIAVQTNKSPKKIEFWHWS